MSGPVEWAVLIFIVTVIISSMGIAWWMRGIVAKYDKRFSTYEQKFDFAMAQLHNEIMDRDFLLKYDLALADQNKDIRHAKKAIEHHGVIFGDMHDDLIRAQSEIERLAKIVNGNH